MHLAASFGHLPMVDFLISRGADIHGRDKEGRTPLLLACMKGFKEVSKYLINKRADLHAKCKVSV